MGERPFVIGYVAGAHGVRGEIKVFPVTDDITRFEKLKEVTVETEDFARPCKITKVWFNKKFVMIKLEDVNDMDGALRLKGAALKIDASQALPLSENEYYVRDLLGMDVYTESGERLGEITDVLVTGANDVYEIDKKLLLPAIKDCVINVDTAGNRMVVRILEGLGE